MIKVYTECFILKTDHLLSAAPLSDFLSGSKQPCPMESGCKKLEEYKLGVGGMIGWVIHCSLFVAKSQMWFICKIGYVSKLMYVNALTSPTSHNVIYVCCANKLSDLTQTMIFAST